MELISLSFSFFGQQFSAKPGGINQYRNGWSRRLAYYTNKQPAACDAGYVLSVTLSSML